MTFGGGGAAKARLKPVRIRIAILYAISTPYCELMVRGMLTEYLHSGIFQPESWYWAAISLHRMWRFAPVWLAVCALSAEAADLVGNKACAPCHAAIVRSYMRTPMAQSSGKAGTVEQKETFDRAEFRDAAGAYSYK